MKNLTICEVILQIRDMVDSLSNNDNIEKIKDIHILAEKAELYAKKMSKKLSEYSGAEWKSDVFTDVRSKSLREKYQCKMQSSFSFRGNRKTRT